MAAEGPFLSALIARLPEPKFNLAAYGVAYAFALLIESPVIMMMSAATALVRDITSYRKLKKFTIALSLAITAVMLILLMPAVFAFLTRDIIGLPKNIADLTHAACIALLPWPGAIGMRRFWQGVLINRNLTRRVAYGTMIRLAMMVISALLLYQSGVFPGVVVGAAALSIGVSVEAIASYFMVRNSVIEMSGMVKEQPSILTYRYIASFYYPLALTSLISLGTLPIVTFFMNQGRFPIESLAVFPVIHALTFIFRSLGLSFQEVTVNFLYEGTQNYRKLRNFATFMGLGGMLILGLIAFTPLSGLWFIGVSGLSTELSNFSIFPTRLLVPIAALSVLMSFQRGLLVGFRHTPPITIATTIEVTLIVVMLVLGIFVFDMIGIVAAAVALIVGRLCANLFLLRPYQVALKKAGGINFSRH